ncbi:hypothetical protein TNCV_2309011 [Trichonephila clavipes]|nr:hypothetical protein TNCV_2309011 [Trichonephila clavipes]
MFEIAPKFLNPPHANVRSLNPHVLPVPLHCLFTAMTPRLPSGEGPGLMMNLTLVFSRQTDHLTGTSAHESQAPRSRLLSWAQYASALMGYRAIELS